MLCTEGSVDLFAHRLYPRQDVLAQKNETALRVRTCEPFTDSPKIRAACTAGVLFEFVDQGVASKMRTHSQRAECIRSAPFGIKNGRYQQSAFRVVALSAYTAA